jgi:hypothetical protein
MKSKQPTHIMHGKQQQQPIMLLIFRITGWSEKHNCILYRQKHVEKHTLRHFRFACIRLCTSELESGHMRKKQGRHVQQPQPATQYACTKEPSEWRTFLFTSFLASQVIYMLYTPLYSLLLEIQYCWLYMRVLTTVVVLPACVCDGRQERTIDRIEHGSMLKGTVRPLCFSWLSYRLCQTDKA